MPLTSDLKLDASKFQPEAISEQTKQFNDKLIKIMQNGPKWYEVRLFVLYIRLPTALLDELVSCRR